jgi:hypothetical protein
MYLDEGGLLERAESWRLRMDSSSPEAAADA